MQAQPGPSQRGYLQRRSPGADPGPPPSVRPSSPGMAGVQPRSSTSSNRSGQGSLSRRPNREGSGGSSSSMPLSQIEKSVTHLLVATKQLLETLTQWSRGQATDTQVSDVYVRLGYEFNMACRAFTAINVDTSDLGNVPDLLRHILEATLSQEASTDSLEKYLPRIRDIIINLLHGLKRKQQRLRQRQGRERDASLPERTTSVSTAASGTSGLTNLLDEGLENGYRPDPSQRGDPNQQTNSGTPPGRRYNHQRDQARAVNIPDQSTITQNIPSAPPYPAEDTTMPPSSSASDLNIDAFPPPPPPPPDTQSSALAALQKGGDLERRASRRYSQYQISKHLGGAANGMPILPSQTTPIPNRGRREARESLRAVQSRESVRHSRTLSSQSKSAAVEASPSRMPGVPEASASAQQQPSGPAELSDGPAVQAPEEKYAPSATLNGPLQDLSSFMGESAPPEPDVKQTRLQSKTDEPPTLPHPTESKPGESFFQVSPPLTPTKDLTLFLQYKSKVKKIVLAEGRDELSIGRLQLAFIEKFSWNTQHNGTDLPEIYIQDPVSGVRHELEDLSDIKDRTVLVLNVEPLDEVKRHFDDGLLALTKIVQSMKQNVDDQGTTLQRVSDRQQETATELARLATASPVPPAAEGGVRMLPGAGRRLNAGQAGELQSLRRDLAVLRQTYSSFQSDVQNSMTSIRQKAANVKSAASTATIPDIEGNAGYSYVTNGRKQLNSDSDRLVGKVDDLQDLIEDLRKDVVHRGVRPLPRQLEEVAKDITNLTKELKKMEEYMANEKPIWTKIWEKELEDVCQGRDELRLMEDLMVDLKDDLDKASETFTLVEQATKEQMKDNGTGASASTARQFSRGLSHLGNSLDQSAAKEDMLGEVRALQPNHENRLEAIERAEKLRQKELEGRRGNAMLREIATYVQEGKLKKSGGFEEVERSRKAKDERIRREVWERQNGIIPEDPIGEEELQSEEQAEQSADGEEFHDAAPTPVTEDAPKEAAETAA
ncbi:actin interacting protein 3 [Metarhizium robertsii ARSEF 23]|uniref:Actin interacting protein 3 n=1 Tax=Metarhizium robertsii (strain ARSEF 23 / ATCC MYA-3075) TaxID=655844 RepID=E9EZB5_METRA|nr:actin interacting protein 3 [Metarhizium robertsii ARSEF 23]EFY99306.1 actin interacting protein 3 [Metarhizium robertsii ARSEF 23]